jgi:hypothetical protein
MDFTSLYPFPSTYKRPDGSARYAFMTFLMRNDSFLPGALVFAYALRQQQTAADLVCLVTKDITLPARTALEELFDKVVEVEEVFIPHKRRQERQDRPFLFTRFQALRAGRDGDLGLAYEKIVLADADVLPLCCYDHLFTLETPAGILNENKSYCMEYDPAGRYIIPPSVAQDGTWIWHAHYNELCPHGALIPREITDRVAHEPNNMGVNSSLWVLAPSQAGYDDLISAAYQTEMNSAITNGFNWPEMQFASLYWSGRWTSIDLRFSSFNAYPELEVLCGTHFAGYKPWNFKETGTISRFSRFPDYALWHATYLGMLTAHPLLGGIPRLARLKENILGLKVPLLSK